MLSREWYSQEIRAVCILISSLFLSLHLLLLSSLACLKIKEDISELKKKSSTVLLPRNSSKGSPKILKRALDHFSCH